MIETKTAMANLDAIAAVPGIDVLFVGPSDLSIGLTDGKELDPHSATVEKALDQIVAACKKAGKVAGLYCANAERAVTCAKRGVRFLAVGSDLGFLRAGTAAQLKVLKGDRQRMASPRLFQSDAINRVHSDRIIFRPRSRIGALIAIGANVYRLNMTFVRNRVPKHAAFVRRQLISLPPRRSCA